jgi:hypothetical protein
MINKSHFLLVLFALVLNSTCGSKWTRPIGENNKLPDHLLTNESPADMRGPQYYINKISNLILKARNGRLKATRTECALHTVYVVQDISDCKNNVSLPVTYCQGHCESSDQYVPNTVERLRTCEICRQTSVKKTLMTIDCDNKTRKIINLTAISGCVCFKIEH